MSWRDDNDEGTIGDRVLVRCYLGFALLMCLACVAICAVGVACALDDAWCPRFLYLVCAP